MIRSSIVNGEITAYLQHLEERKFAEAEKELENMRKKFDGTERGKGFIRALEGFYLAKKTNDDKYLFLTRMDLSRKSILQYKKEFTEQSVHPLYAEYDRGYFEALVEYMKFLQKAEPWRKGNTANHDKISKDKS